MSEDNVVGFITVRSSSTRLPNKCLLPFGEGNVLSHVINRALNFGITPIVCTSVDASDDVIESVANGEGVRCFRGALSNKLKRWADCSVQFNVESFHTIDADDPFFDANEIMRSMKMLKENDLDMVCPTESSSSGGASVGYSLTRDIVQQATKSQSDDVDTEMMWYFVEKVQSLRSETLPEVEQNVLKVRLTLDYEEDYWLLESVRKMVGNFAPRSKVDQLFRRNPDLHKVNWFRNDEWKKAQLDKQI